MVQPIRPHDASGIYRQQIGHAEAAETAANTRRGGNASNGERTDRVTVSDGAREFARVMDAVQSAPDIRTDRVQELRNRIESGQYEIDYHGLAGLLHDRGVNG